MPLLAEALTEQLQCVFPPGDKHVTPLGLGKQSLLTVKQSHASGELVLCWRWWSCLLIYFFPIFSPSFSISYLSFLPEPLKLCSSLPVEASSSAVGHNSQRAMLSNSLEPGLSKNMLSSRENVWKQTKHRHPAWGSARAVPSDSRPYAFFFSFPSPPPPRPPSKIARKCFVTTCEQSNNSLHPGRETFSSSASPRHRAMAALAECTVPPTA